MSIVCDERYFDSVCGEAHVRYLTWKDDAKKPIGIYLIAHGVCEHIERYDGFAKYLVERGFIVYGEDHLGHGKSAGPIENIGQMPMDSDKYIIEDMHVMYNIAKTENPDIPVFLFGHSMGSFIAKIYSAKYGSGLKGAVYCGTGTYPAVLRHLKYPFKYALNFIGPEKKTLVEGSMTSTAWLSVDKENRKNYLADPYITKYYSIGLLRDVCLLAVGSSLKGWSDTIPASLPILFISGSHDIIGFCGYGINKAEKEARRTGHINVEKILYKRMRHEILLESKVKDQVCKDVYDWTMKNYK